MFSEYSSRIFFPEITQTPVFPVLLLHFPGVFFMFRSTTTKAGMEGIHGRSYTSGNVFPPFDVSARINEDFCFAETAVFEARTLKFKNVCLYFIVLLKEGHRWQFGKF